MYNGDRMAGNHRAASPARERGSSPLGLPLLARHAGSSIEFGAWGVRFGVWGLRFEVWGLWVGVWGLGFGVWGLGFGV